jgi:predicted outer membrane repeat protein
MATVLLSAVPTWAATLTVTSSGDSGSGSLRNAINSAATGDTITFAPGLATITLTSGPAAITANVTINGAGSPVITSNGSGGVFVVTSATDVTFDDITIDGLNSATDGGAISIDQGNSADTVTVKDSTFEHDDASGYDGAALADVGSGTLSVTGSTFENDDVGSGDGGAIFNGSGSTLAVSASSLFEANSAAAGGAIYSQGATTVASSTLQGNSSSGGGGAIDSVAPNPGSARLDVTNSSFIGNTATSNGGAIDDGDGGGSEAVIEVGGSEFVGNTATNGSGGAIADLASLFPAMYSFVWASTFVGDQVGSATDGYAIYANGNQTFQVAGNLFAEDCAGTIMSVGYNAALPAGNPSGTGSACVGSAVQASDSVSSAAAEVIKSTQNSQLMVAEEDNPAIDLIPDNTTVNLGGPTVPEPLCPVTDLLGDSGPDATGRCDAGALQSHFQPSGPSGGPGSGGGGGSVGTTTTTTTPTTTTPVTTTTPPKPKTITTKVKFDNQQIKLISPSLYVCTAVNAKLKATLSSGAIKHSKKPKLRFSLAKFLAGGKDRLTVKRLTAHASIKLKKLKAKSTDRLTVKLSYREPRKHKKAKTVSKTITVKFKVC